MMGRKNGGGTEGAKGGGGGGEGLTGVARAAAKLLAALPSPSADVEQLAASALRRSYTRTYASPPATVNCQGRQGLQCIEFSTSGFACTTT